MSICGGWHERGGLCARFQRTAGPGGHRAESGRSAQGARSDLKDGHQLLPSDIYVDDGYSGATLLRPALERLRDQAALGSVDLVYVLSPDRLARKYGLVILLLEEFKSAGTDLVFLDRQGGDTPEDDLLLQVQGMIAEYEKAKILERCRRGKLHRARQGSVSVLCQAPYGYRYVRKSEHQDARYEILEEEAAVVRRFFDWVVLEQLSLRAIARRLRDEGILTRTGLRRWDPATLSSMLRNPAYAGRACYGKTEATSRARMTKPARAKGNLIPRLLKSSSRAKPQDEWVTIEVPAIVSEAIFEAAQQQLERSRRLAGRNNKKGLYLPLSYTEHPNQAT